MTSGKVGQISKTESNARWAATDVDFVEYVSFQDQLRTAPNRLSVLAVAARWMSSRVKDMIELAAVDEQDALK